MEKTFSVKGMSCNHCVMAVETELRDANFGNFKVKVGSVKVEYNTPEDESKIITAIEEAGFKVIS